MTPADRFEYAVEGFGDFPLDMLRHDCAYPADEESVAAIMAGLRWAASRKRSRETLRVRLLSHRAPTSDRWRSFGWTVTASRPDPEKRGTP
ncbi:MAG: hypothetical protein M3O99_09950 [Chloroflexota bacterium]|nr:hypothetical protein [Chloroflexota bacterium]